MNGEYRHMGRKELIALLEKTQREKEGAEERIRALEEALVSREIQIDRAGSIAEASLSLNGVFVSAQAAAEGYLDALRASVFRSETMEKAARQRADAIMNQALQEKERILQGAQERAEQTRTEALQVRQQIYEQTAKEILLRWKECEQGYFSKE